MGCAAAAAAVDVVGGTAAVGSGGGRQLLVTAGGAVVAEDFCFFAITGPGAAVELLPPPEATPPGSPDKGAAGVERRSAPVAARVSPRLGGRTVASSGLDFWMPASVAACSILRQAIREFARRK